MGRRVRKPHQRQQARPRFLAEAVLEAAERVVPEVGWSKAKVSRIAKVSGVSVGSLYRYFPGRDILQPAIIDRTLLSDLAVFRSAVEAAQGETVEESLEAFANTLLANERLTHPALLRKLVDRLDAAGRLETVQQRFDEMIRKFAEHIAVQHPELGPLELVERRCHIALWGMRAAFVARVRVEDPFDFAAFRVDALHLTAAMLRRDEAAAPDDEQRQTGDDERERKVRCKRSDIDHPSGARLVIDAQLAAYLINGSTQKSIGVSTIEIGRPPPADKRPEQPPRTRQHAREQPGCVQHPGCLDFPAARAKFPR